MIGIWWDNGTEVVAFPVKETRPDPMTGLCDSDDSHDDRWSEAAARLGVAKQDEYFSVPRGRVLYDPRAKRHIIYHGNQTTGARLTQIAEVFCLETWIGLVDSHYLMGAAADDYFSDDDY